MHSLAYSHRAVQTLRCFESPSNMLTVTMPDVAALHCRHRVLQSTSYQIQTLTMPDVAALYCHHICSCSGLPMAGTCLEGMLGRLTVPMSWSSVQRGTLCTLRKPAHIGTAVVHAM